MRRVTALLDLVLLAIIVTKPVIDFTWQLKWRLHGFDLNLQSITAMWVALYSFAIAVRWLIAPNGPWERRLASIYLPLVIFLAYRGFATHFFIKVTVQYICAFSGGIAIPHLWTRLKQFPHFKRPVTQAVFLTITLVVASLILQLAEIIPWQRVDTLFNIGNVWRLTGFYEHPFDVFRVLIWPINGLIIYLSLRQSGRRARGAYILLFFLNVLALRTTFRTALLAVIWMPFILLYLTGSVKRCASIVVTIVVAWSMWGLFPYSKPYCAGVFSSVHFLSIEWPTRHSNTTSSIEGTQDPEPTITLARGRSKIWMEHIHILAHRPWTNYISGITAPIDPAQSYPEPHSQWIDFFEVGGLINLLMFAAFMSMLVFYTKPTRVILISAGWVVSWFCLTGEPFGSPTFAWAALLFLGHRMWLDHSEFQKYGLSLEQPTLANTSSTDYSTPPSRV